MLKQCEIYCTNLSLLWEEIIQERMKRKRGLESASYVERSGTDTITIAQNPKSNQKAQTEFITASCSQNCGN